MEFYKKYADVQADVDELIKMAKSLGDKISEKELDLKEILSYLDDELVPIVILDWKVIKGTKEKVYLGHFVPLVGYDDENV
ncbi:hypothetical protein COU54_02260 [Candidatus Pacearchaeota archaeon CG10_big_fil_rev_8_21_14_0_10_31_24]|nr:MAG: hypothetical protein COU54_02260 [Candidatus Pacearchaeota archaeon CG10_big_fil_rev_8_21_14_0_10_31_24]